MRFCDLKLSIQRAPLARHVRRLYADLERRGIEFRPHVWLSEEWFSPDGVPGIAMPFYLAHPRLERLERRIMREAEGGDPRLLLRILRHEAGHALDNAYATWTKFTTGGDQILLTRSTDGGATFSNPRPLSPDYNNNHVGWAPGISRQGWPRTGPSTLSGWTPLTSKLSNASPFRTTAA